MKGGYSFCLTWKVIPNLNKTRANIWQWLLTLTLFNTDKRESLSFSIKHKRRRVICINKFNKKALFNDGFFL